MPEVAPELRSASEIGGVSRDVNGEQVDDIVLNLEQAEARAIELQPEQRTFLATVIEARKLAAEDPAVMMDCCVRLKAHNRKLKQYIATADAQAVKESFSGGFLGQGDERQEARRSAHVPLEVAAPANQAPVPCAV